MRSSRHVRTAYRALGVAGLLLVTAAVPSRAIPSFARQTKLILTLIYMLATKTVHPPAGANPLIMIHAHAGFLGLWQPVGLGIIILVLVAMVWSRIWPGMHRYPANWFEKSPPSTLWGGWSK